MTQKETVYAAYLVHILSNINRSESCKQDSFIMCLNFGCFKNLSLLYSRVGTGAAGAASKFVPGAGAA
jgi:hypothetical protein